MEKEGSKIKEIKPGKLAQRCQVCESPMREILRGSVTTEPIAGGVQGPALGPLVGSRGEAPAGFQGAVPPEAPGF